MDITEVILTQHHRQRQAFAQLDEIPRDDTAALTAAWDRLDILEITEVEAEPVGDVMFPAIGSDWQETDRDERDGFAFITFRRLSE